MQNVDNPTILAYGEPRIRREEVIGEERVAVAGGSAEEGRRGLVILGATREEPPPGIEAVLDSAKVEFAASGEELRRVIRGAEALFVWDFRARDLKDAWEEVDELRWIHVAGAGVDAVLFPALIESYVTLTNSRGVFDRSIAEYVLGLMLILAKDLHRTLAFQREKEWRHRETGMIAGKSLLVVGVGGIGREISRSAKALGMRPSAVARTRRDTDPDFERVFASRELDEALPHADYVVAAAPLTGETKGMFGAGQFRRMKSGARFINIGRGEIVDEAALIEALRDGRLSGAGLDVFREEPLPAQSPLWEMENVIVSPHMSGDFVGWLDALGELFTENFRRWRDGEELLNIVDKEKGYAG